MLDVAEKQWSQAVLEQFAIPSNYLPKLIDSSGQTGIYNPIELKSMVYSKKSKSLLVER